MKKSEHREDKGHVELAIVLAILFLILAVIGVLIFRITHSGASARPTIQSVLATPEPTPAPTPTPVPTPVPTPEPTPEPTPDLTQFINIATSTRIKITKQPGGEKLYAGNNAVFVAHASGAASREWRFVSPEYDREIVWNDREFRSEFPGVKCEDGNTDTLIIYSVPAKMDGWYAVCLYTDSDGGMLATDGAQISILN